jgi:hypothetical protein
MGSNLARAVTGAFILAAVVAAAVVVAVTGPVLAAARPRSSSPAAADVVGGRFVTPVSLDGGVLTVTPAPTGDRPTVAKSAAAQKIWASPVMNGRNEGPLGYGIVTITRHAKGVPRISTLPAWVGFARSTSAYGCPDEPSPPSTGPSRARPVSLPSDGYAAIVIGAARGTPAVSYTARSEVCLSVQAASLAVATEVLSVPWQPISGIEGGSMQVRVTIPPCGSLEGVSSGGSAKGATITIGAVVPDAPSGCGPSSTITQTVFLGPPNNPPGAPPSPVSASTPILHAPLGPVHLAMPAPK